MSWLTYRYRVAISDGSKIWSIAVLHVIRGNVLSVVVVVVKNIKNSVVQVMPDNKTVYTTDDGTNVGFYMFKSDNAGPDLSSGNQFPNTHR